MGNVRIRSAQKLPAVLIAFAAIAISAISATRIAAADQPATAIVAVEEDGHRAAPPDQGSRGTPDIKGEATRRERRPTSKNDDPGHPEPSWQLPAPGCPYSDRPLNLIV